MSLLLLFNGGGPPTTSRTYSSALEVATGPTPASSRAYSSVIEVAVGPTPANSLTYSIAIEVAVSPMLTGASVGSTVSIAVNGVKSYDRSGLQIISNTITSQYSVNRLGVGLLQPALFEHSSSTFGKSGGVLSQLYSCNTSRGIKDSISRATIPESLVMFRDLGTKASTGSAALDVTTLLASLGMKDIVDYAIIDGLWASSVVSYGLEVLLGLITITLGLTSVQQTLEILTTEINADVIERVQKLVNEHESITTLPNS